MSVDADHPTFNSYVGRPGLSVKPFADDNIIVYSSANDNDYAKYVDQLQETWDSLDPANQTEGYVDCKNGSTPPEGSFCRFDRTSLGEFCVPPDFGYDKGRPCVFLSLNRVVDWEPEDYEPGSIPEEIVATYKPGNIAFHCTSYKNRKPEQLGEQTRMYPSAGMPFYYYPFVGTTNKTLRSKYKQPYVAVRFDLQVKEENIKVQCKTYTASIDAENGMYNTDFESQVTFSFHLSKDPAHLEL